MITKNLNVCLILIASIMSVDSALACSDARNLSGRQTENERIKSLEIFMGDEDFFSIYDSKNPPTKGSLIRIFDQMERLDLTRSDIITLFQIHVPINARITPQEMSNLSVYLEYQFKEISKTKKKHKFSRK